MSDKRKPGNPLAVYLEPEEAPDQTMFAAMMTKASAEMFGPDGPKFTQSAVSMIVTGARPATAIQKAIIAKASDEKVPVNAWPAARRPKTGRKERAA